MTVPPEIKRLRAAAAGSRTGTVSVVVAEQAVRDAEARYQSALERQQRMLDHARENYDHAHAESVRLAEAVGAARREAFREAVEALRDEPVGDDFHDAIVFLERRFLTSEGEDDGR